jgi:hypothetical protein
LLLSGPPDYVLDGDDKARIVGLDLHLIHLNQISEPLLQRALHDELSGGCKLLAIGREYELPQPAAKVRPVHALARRRKQHLFYQVANMPIVARASGPSEAIELKRIKDVHLCHIPVTLSWVKTTTSGVPVGAHIAWLSCKSSGWPLEVIRVAAVMN